MRKIVFALAGAVLLHAAQASAEGLVSPANAANNAPIEQTLQGVTNGGLLQMNFGL